MVYLALLLILNILRCTICEDFQTTRYKLIIPNECLIQYNTDSALSTRVQCGALCTGGTGCYQFLHCPATGYCWINGRQEGFGLPTGCDCYSKDSVFQCQNGGTLIAKKTCSCIIGYYGNRCERIIRDCTEGQELSLSNQRTQESFIQPYGAQGPFTVLCDFEYGLTFMLYRGPNSCGRAEIFDRPWDEYVEGFGKLDCEHWLGLEKLHKITSQGSYQLEILIDDGEDYYQCYYTQFGIEGADTDYRAYMPITHSNAFCNEFLKIGSGLDINGQPFSTFDHDTHGFGCPGSLQGAWWFKTGCGNSNMNGPYVTKSQFDSNPRITRLQVGGPFSDKWIKNLIFRIERTGP